MRKHFPTRRFFALRKLYCRLVIIILTGVLLTSFSANNSAPPLLTKQSSDGQFPWEPSLKSTVPSHTDLVSKRLSTAQILEAGANLFSHRFTVPEGFGRPEATGNQKPTVRINTGHPLMLRTAGPDANSCAGCHFQPLVGGSGDFAANVFVGAQFTDPPTTLVTSEVTNERNTISVFGAGIVELIAREITADLLNIRESAVMRAAVEKAPVTLALISKGISYGSLTAHPSGWVDMSKVDGIDRDLIVKPFGAKGVAVSIREFTNFALNHHHGIQPIERFGWTRTGIKDFDGDGKVEEFSVGEVTVLSLFQAALPAPGRKALKTKKEQNEHRQGATIFSEIGCGDCHIPELPLSSNVFTEPNPYNRWGSLQPSDGLGTVSISIPAIGSALKRKSDGTYLVSIFSDFKRHKICDQEIKHFCNEKIRQDFVPLDEFLTSKLWDVGSSSPYGHRGDLTTLTETILQHGGSGRTARSNFIGLPDDKKKALIMFLRSLSVCDNSGCS